MQLGKEQVDANEEVINSWDREQNDGWGEVKKQTKTKRLKWENKLEQ